MRKNYVEKSPREVYAVKVRELHTELMNALSVELGVDIGIQSRIENGLITLHIGKETKTVGHSDYLVIDFTGIRIYTLDEFKAIFKTL